MKIVKFILKIVIPLLLIILIIDYARINIRYYLSKNMYTESFDIRGNTNNYVPQGITYSKEYNVIIQTSYNKQHNVSMIYITDFKTGNLLKELKLKDQNNKDNTKHVGGITTKDKKILISSEYTLDEYSLIEIMNTNNDYIKSIKSSKLLNRGDFCLYNNNTLWIGDFFLNPFYPVPDNNPLLMGYEIKANMDYKKPDYIISLPKMIQGMAITDDNKFIFTASYTNLINSQLLIYDNPLKGKNDYYKINNKDIPYYKLNENNLIKSIKLAPMAEGLFYKDKNIYVLFENSSNAYFYAYPKITKLIKLDTNKLDK